MESLQLPVPISCNLVAINFGSNKSTLFYSESSRFMYLLSLDFPCAACTWSQVPLMVVLDVEATGLDVENDRVIQVCTHSLFLLSCIIHGFSRAWKMLV
jgi:hypothetical protein